MESDIKLDVEKVVLKGRWIEAQAWDLWLDAPDRRRDSSGTSRYRRALVHNGEDGLTINYESDYPAGVTVEGPTKMNKKVTFSDSPTVPDLKIWGLAFARERVGSGGGGSPLTPRGPLMPITPHRPISGVLAEIPPILEPASLVEIIKALRSKIKALEERVQTLEGESGG